MKITEICWYLYDQKN